MDLHILGTRGVPANHSGFETFAEQLSLYLVSRGHTVTVYCQLGPQEAPFTDVWHGVRRVALAEGDGSWGTIRFDLRSALIASRQKGATLLTLGYNTALFSIIHRLRGRYHLMNMDGLEWKRQKWSRIERLWFAINEFLGAKLANHLIADHPEIRNHLLRYVSRRKITVIPYGADTFCADAAGLAMFGLEPQKYALVIARPEPENSILEIVRAYSREPRSYRLVVLGRYCPETNPYHADVIREGNNTGVLFPGAIHDTHVTEALRSHTAVYIHGHQVGGTNPSLIASLAAGNAVLAHDNRFNRWVAGPCARYFTTEGELAAHFEALEQGRMPLATMRDGSQCQHARYFENDPVMQAYERILVRLLNEEARWD